MTGSTESVISMAPASSPSCTRGNRRTTHRASTARSNASSSRRCRPSHAAIAATCSLRSGLPTATTRATSRSLGGSAAAGTGRRHWRMLRSRTPISASTRCWLPRRKTSPGSGHELGEDGARARTGAARVRRALASRWDENASAYRELDLHGGEPETTGTIGDLLPLYAGVPDERRARRLYDEALWSPARFGPSPDAPWPVTTVSKASELFDARRYWRGPVWINVNWFLLRGLARAGLAAEAEELRRMTLRLVAASGFTEYYHPVDGRAARKPRLLLERGPDARPHARPAVSYDPEPHYPVVGGEVRVGYGELAAELARRRPCVVAVDGPAALPLGARLPLPSRTPSVPRDCGAAAWTCGDSWRRGRRCNDGPRPRTWRAIRFSRGASRGRSRCCSTSSRGSLSTAEDDLTLVLGPGSALVDHDFLWYADLPKRLSLDAVRRGLAGNLGQPPGEAGSEQRLLFVDWPVLDRHKHALAPHLDGYVDLTDPDSPRSLDGEALRRSLARARRCAVQNSPDVPARPMGRSVAEARPRASPPTPRTSPGRTS